MPDYTVARHGTDSSGRPILLTNYMANWWAGVCKRLGFEPTIVQGAFMARLGGGAAASAGYHDQAGCIDIRVWDIGEEKARKVVRECRRSGAAAWLRDERHGGMDPHIHVVLGSDSPLAAGAATQWRQYLAGLDGLASGGRDYHWRPSPIVTKPPAPPRRRLNIRLANLWRENEHVTADLDKLLADRTAHLVNINEGANHTDEIITAAERHHYRAYGVTGTRAERQNPILVRDDIRTFGYKVHQMCQAVGTSPARHATAVLYQLGSEKRVHVNTHMNSHVQEGPADPHELPRVEQYVDHMKRLARMVRDNRKTDANPGGWQVTVSGDLNWSYSAKIVGWYWSPKRTFKRLGMRVQWAGRDATAPSHGRRRIDYIAHHPDDLRIAGQRLLDGHSDHRWPEVHYIVQETP